MNGLSGKDMQYSWFCDCRYAPRASKYSCVS
jgi:hypothetical protein